MGKQDTAKKINAAPCFTVNQQQQQAQQDVVEQLRRQMEQNAFYSAPAAQQPQEQTVQRKKFGAFDKGSEINSVEPLVPIKKDDLERCMAHCVSEDLEVFMLQSQQARAAFPEVVVQNIAEKEKTTFEPIVEEKSKEKAEETSEEETEEKSESLEDKKAQAELQLFKAENSIGILKLIADYSSPKISASERKILIKSIKASLDAVFVTKIVPLTEEGEKKLQKYFDYFNNLSIGNLQVPEKDVISSVDNPFIRINGVVNPPVEKEFNRKPLVKKDMSEQPLFDHEPHVSDIRQGCIGDCYFLAAIASMVSKGPQSVKDIMRDNGDGTVTVRFMSSKSLKKIEIENYLKSKSYEELSPRDRLVRAIHETPWEQMTETIPMVTNILTLVSQAPLEAVQECAEKLLALPGWKNKSMELKDGLSAKDTFLAQLKELRDYNKANQATDSLKKYDDLYNESHNSIKEHSARMEQRDGKKPSTTVNCPVYVTVKKETSVFKKSGEDAYANDTLWVQLLERAYAASGLVSAEEDGIYGYKALDEGGQPEVALEALLGKNGAELFNYSGNANINIDSGYSLFGSLNKAVGGNISTKLIEKLPMLKNAPPEATNELIRILQEADASHIKTVKAKGKQESYRVDAADLDEIVPLITSSRLVLIADKEASAQENVQLRSQLAESLTQLLAGSERSLLSFRPFSGKYSASAIAIYDKIISSLAANEHLNAGSTMFVPESVINSPGLNNEGMKAGIAERHAYTVLGVKEMQGIKYVTLRNPWGNTIRSYYKNDEGEIFAAENTVSETSGIFQVELNDFVANFNRVTKN